MSDYLEPQSGDVIIALPASAIEPIWRTLRAALERQSNDGGMVRPDIERSLVILRSAASAAAAMSATGHDSRTSSDIAQPSELLDPFGLADALGVSERHARRIAKAEGVKPAARGLWRRIDVEALVARRATR